MLGAIVVGGGYAGVSAAVELERLGHGPVTLLEGAERLGGRALSVPVPGSDERQALDLGAHYFGRRHRRVHALANRLVPSGAVFDRLGVYGPDPAFRIYTDGKWRVTTHERALFGIQGLPRTAPIAHGAAVVDSLCRFLSLESRIDVERPWRTPNARALDAITAEQWIARQPVPGWIHDMWRLALIDIQSVYPEEVSLLYWLWYAASNGGFLHIANDFEGGPQELAVDCGLGGLLQRFAEEIRGDVVLGTPAVAIDHRAADRVAVETADGTVREARHVVVAVTPAVAGEIRYTPQVSAARELLHKQRAGHAAKAIVYYREPWWWDSHGFHHIGFSGGARRDGVEWILDTSHPSAVQHSLTAFVSDVLLDRVGPDPEARRVALAEAMADVTGDSRARKFLAVELCDWREKPGIRGGPNTSFGPSVLTKVGGVFNRPEGAHRRLWFAASEYATTFTGYVEGALAAGERVAAQIAGGRPRRPEPGPRWHRVAAFVGARALLAPFWLAVRAGAAWRGWPEL